MNEASDFQVHKLPDGTRLNEMSPEAYAWRVGVAQGLAERDWEGNPNHPDWERRYINLITGLSLKPIQRLEALSRDERIGVISYAMHYMGADLDKPNLLAVTL